MRIDKNTTIRLGDRNIVKVKLGDVVIWQKTTGPVEGPDYFYIESLGDGNTISVKNVGDGSTGSETPTLEYSTDKNTWDTITFDWTSGTHTTELPVKLNTGGKMYFRNNTRLFSNSSSKYISFSSTVSSNVGGDIRTLSNYLNVNSETTPQTGMFRSLFNGNNKIVDASNLRLPYNTLASGCYYEMFKGCTSLTTAPTLPATTLAIYCYQYMFQGCSSLTTAPELPATTLADSCYQYMFRDCTSLTTAPVLLAITLAGGCYKGMFYRCTSLTTAPALVSTTMSNDCYGYMFSGCTSLNKILVYANSINSSGVEDWLSNVAATGTFYNAGSAVYTTDSPSGIPTGWTEVKTVPTTTSVYAVPDTFSAKSWMDKTKPNYTIIGVNETGIDVPLSEQNELITIGKNTGSSTVTHTETLTYDGLDYTITINQTANDTDEPDYFYIESLGDGNTISVKNQGNGDTTNVTHTLEYSTDKNTWNTITFDWASGEHTTELPIALNTGEKMYFRNDTRKFSDSSSKYISFSSSVSSNVGGDIRTLSNYLDVDSETTPQSYMFYFLFTSNKNIVDASNLRLPYTTLAEYCYNGMFQSCSKLTSAPPALPATTLANYCYSIMFRYCTSLTSAPELPATTLARSCYSSMFDNCTSLTSAPELPATTLAEYCYNGMFQSCSKLTSAPPALPATTLANYCYGSMFNGCKSLTSAPALPATTLSDYCYQNMFRDCSSLTTAPELPATTCKSNCYVSMFDNCTSLTSAPELPATTLSNYCYSNMFNGCTSLTSAPALPATTLSDYCYESMFSSCSKLTSAPTLPATTLVSSCYSDMFQDCTSLTAAPELPATNLADSCYYRMFMGCTSLTAAPALPATTLVSSCYSDMFNSCTALTSAPELPATTLARSCYSVMFRYCTSLTSAPELPATTLVDFCYNGMFLNCTSLTTAPALPATTLAYRCYETMFQNCKSLNEITVYADDISATNCTSNWLSGVASSGTFNNYGSATYTANSPSGIPTGWTEVKN